MTPGTAGAAAIDHVIWAESSLRDRPAMLEARLGVRFEDGGRHASVGTRNALGGLGRGVYLELLGPDPESAPKGSLGERLAGLDEPALYHWALRVDDLDAVAEAAAAAGVDVGAIVPWSRRKADGTLLTWKLLFVDEPTYGAAAPFFIDWGDTPHPSTGLTAVGRLLDIRPAAPGVSRLNRLLEGIGSPVLALEAERIALEASMTSLGGEVVTLSLSPSHAGGITR